VEPRDGARKRPSTGTAPKSRRLQFECRSIEHRQGVDESEWGSGYKVDLWYGPDANTLGTHSAGANTSDFTIKQAYVALRTPVGNGIDWKIGVFDTIIGYESSESPNNPNFTRSYGYTIEPTTHTGLLGTYRFCEEVSVSAGVANTFGPAINGRAFAGNGVTASGAESYRRTWLRSLSRRRKVGVGLLGSTLYAGVIDGFNAASPANGSGKQTSWYAGATVATPVTGLKFGLAFDYLDSGGTTAFNGCFIPTATTSGRSGLYALTRPRRSSACTLAVSGKRPEPSPNPPQRRFACGQFASVVGYWHRTI